MKIALWIVVGLLAVIVLGLAGVLVTMRFADGPKGPIPGGALKAGQLMDASHVDWQRVLGDQSVAEIELQLEDPVSSRTTGAFAHEGELYVPCDLGYVWRRLPQGTARVVLHTIWLFKDWHEKAALDGRVVIRVEGKRYALNATRVTDEDLLREFRERISAAAGSVFELLPTTTNPQDIWFFHLEPRK